MLKNKCFSTGKRAKSPGRSLSQAAHGSLGLVLLWPSRFWGEGEGTGEPQPRKSIQWPPYFATTKVPTIDKLHQALCPKEQRIRCG